MKYSTKLSDTITYSYIIALGDDELTLQHKIARSIKTTRLMSDSLWQP